jgi:hypothetical protein
MVVVNAEGPEVYRPYAITDPISRARRAGTSAPAYGCANRMIIGLSWSLDSGPRAVPGRTYERSTVLNFPCGDSPASGTMSSVTVLHFVRLRQTDATRVPVPTNPARRH